MTQEAQEVVRPECFRDCCQVVRLAKGESVVMILFDNHDNNDNYDNFYVSSLTFDLNI